MTVTIINTQTTSTIRELTAGQAGAILAGGVVNYTGTNTAIASSYSEGLHVGGMLYSQEMGYAIWGPTYSPGALIVAQTGAIYANIAMTGWTTGQVRVENNGTIWGTSFGIDLHG